MNLNLGLLQDLQVMLLSFTKLKKVIFFSKVIIMLKMLKQLLTNGI